MESENLGEKASSVFFRDIPQLIQIQAPIPASTFIHQSRERNTALEFELVSQLTDTKRHKILLHTTSAEERVLNRYRDDRIFEHSRVKLKKKVQNQFKDIDYINANFVSEEPYKVILTQGPKAGTLKDFYLMLRQQKIEYVIMLCNIKEDGRTKCEDYFSGHNQYKLIQTQQISPVLIIRTLRDSSTGHIYKHLHYTGWEDHSVPINYEDIGTILSLIDQRSGVVIHCSAGIGRSGTLAIIMKCLIDLQKQGQVSVFGNTRKVRESRYGSVKNNQQYQFIYDYLRSYIKCKKNLH